MWQGTKIRNGITATISGNHITLNGTKTNVDISNGGGYYTDNHINLFDMPSVWYTFPAGTQITVVVSNASGTSNANIANAVVALRQSDNTILTNTTWGERNETINYTFNSNTNVYGILFYLAAGETVTNYQFDLEFWVNGVRWF